MIEWYQYYDSNNVFHPFELFINKIRRIKRKKKNINGVIFTSVDLTLYRKRDIDIGQNRVNIE